MDPGEVGNIEKSLDLATGKAVDFKGRAVDLLEALIVPVGKGGQRHRVFRIESQAGPDEPVALLDRVAGEIKLRRYRPIGA